MLGIVALQVLERQKEQHAVLAAGNADCDPVALVYHAVIVNGLADNAGKFVKCAYVHAKTSRKMQK